MDISASRPTRRGFLGGVVASSVAAAMGENAIDASAGATTIPSARTLHAAAFRGALGSSFTVKVGFAHYSIRLTDVETLNMANLPHHAVAGQRRTTGEQYSLSFVGSGAHPFGQGTYTVTNRRIGSTALFLAPIGARGRTQTYQAVIVNV